MMALRKVKDHPDLVKDDQNKAILNVDQSALDAYKKRREQSRMMSNVCTELDQVKNDVQEIKSMIQQIINNSTENKGVR